MLRDKAPLPLAADSTTARQNRRVGTKKIFKKPLPEPRSRTAGSKQTIPCSRSSADSKHKNLRIRAKLLLKACPGSETSSLNRRFRSPLIDLIDAPLGSISEEDLDRLEDYIKWRNIQLAFADNLVCKFGLPQPDRKKIREWNRNEWQYKYAKVSSVREPYDKAMGRLLLLDRGPLKEPKLFEDPPEGLGPIWHQPVEYLAAALALGCKSLDDLDALLLKMDARKSLFSEFITVCSEPQPPAVVRFCLGFRLLLS
jgi:hypothetical protein